MKIKILNKLTNEFEIVEVLDFNGKDTITQQAGRGIMVTTYDDNYELTEYNEETN